MFDFITDEHKMLQEAARDFAQNSIAPIAEHHDHTGEFPIDTVRQMGQLTADANGNNPQDASHDENLPRKDAK